MKELTKAEEQVMQILWSLEKGFVRDILAAYPEPKPAYNTVSTIVRILESKQFIGHKAFGKSHLYHPLVSKDDYRKFSMHQIVEGYFGGSAGKLLSFFVQDKNIDSNELDELLQIIETAKNKR
jgi:BlaI family transcriptional regulator, penicillinase repressor